VKWYAMRVKNLRMIHLSIQRTIRRGLGYNGFQEW
jgi:hypothetical protein